MPTNVNKRRAAENDDGPLGKGTVCSQIIDICAQTRRRAVQLNECENSRLKLSTKNIDRHARYNRNVSERAMNRLNKSLTMLEAYKDVLSNDYKVSNFDTIQPGFDIKQALRDPARKRRSIFETRIYNSGFSLKNFKSEIDRRLLEIDPTAQRENLRTTLLEESRRRNEILIDRTMPFPAVVKTMMNNYTSGDSSSSVRSVQSHHTTRIKNHKRTTKPMEVTKAMVSKSLSLSKNNKPLGQIERTNLDSQPESILSPVLQMYQDEYVI